MNRIAFLFALGCLLLGGSAAFGDDKDGNVVAITLRRDLTELPRLFALEQFAPEEAVAGYQLLIEANFKEEFRRQLLPTVDSLEEDETQTLFFGMRTFLIDHIQKLKGGPAIYQKLFDHAAKSALGDAIKEGDVDQLLNVVARFPLSNPARHALDQLGALELNRGHFSEALAYWERALATFPQERPLTAVSIGRAAYAASLCARPATLKQLDRLCRLQYADDTLSIAGTEVPLPDYVSRMLTTADPNRPRPLNLAEWTSHGGNRSNTKLMGPDTVVDARRWVLPNPLNPNMVPDPRYPAVGAAPKRMKEARHDQLAQYAPFYPVAANGMLYLNLIRAVYAVPLDGDGVPRWQSPVKKEAFAERLQNHSDVIASCVVEDGLIYANLLLNDPDNIQMGQRGTTFKGSAFAPLFGVPNRLACIKASTGELIWKTGKEFASFAYVTPPVKLGNRLYAAAVERTKPETRISLIAVNASTGKLLYKTIISGMQETVKQMEKRALVGTPSAIPSPLVESAGRLYLSTNVGSIACVEASSGDIVWLTLYKEDRLHQPRELLPLDRPRSARWHNNPPLLLNDLLCITPTDTSFLYVFDAASGTLLNELTVGNGNGRFLFGAHRNRLYVAGDQLSAFQIENIEKIPKPKTAERFNKMIRLLWTQPLPAVPVGMPAMSRTRIYLPLPEELYLCNADTGALQTEERFRWATLTTPEDARHKNRADRRTAGNLTVLNNTLIAASNYNIGVLHNLRQETDRLALSTRGTDSAIRAKARIARAYHQAGQFETARDHYQAALDALDRYRGNRLMSVEAFYPVTARNAATSYRPKSIALEEKLETGLVGVAFDLALRALRNGQFAEAQTALNAIKTDRTKDREALEAQHLSDKAISESPLELLPTQIRFAQYAHVIRGARAYAFKRVADQLLVAGQYAKADLAYRTFQAAWAEYEPYALTSPFTDPLLPGLPLTPDQVATDLFTAQHLPHSYGGFRLLKEGQFEKAEKALLEGILKNNFLTDNKTSVQTITIVGVEETLLAELADRTLDALQATLLARMEQLALTDLPASKEKITLAIQHARSDEETIAIWVKVADLYERLSQRTTAVAVLQQMGERFGEKEFPFKKGKAKVSDYVARRTEALQKGPPPAPVPIPTPKKEEASH